MADVTIFPSLRDKVVLLTGGSQGIGAAAVTLFALNHARVTFLDIDSASAEALISGLNTEHPSLSHSPDFLPCDVTDLTTLKSCAESVIKKYGRIDVLVNNAFGSSELTKAPTSDITPESFELDINLSLRHQFFLTQYVAPHMPAHSATSSIINMGSITWRIPATDVPVYSLSKAAVLGMTRVHARELGKKYGIRVNSVMPGSIATERQREKVLTKEYERMTMETQCLERVIEPVEVARLILFLASADASAMTGGSHVVDAGWVGDT